MHNPTVGYCQGMNFIVGIGLLFLEAEDCFWLLVAVTERYFTPHYFDCGLIGAQADQELLKELLKRKAPELHDHLCVIGIDISSITFNWFIAIFIDSVPFEVRDPDLVCFLTWAWTNDHISLFIYSGLRVRVQMLLRIWDCFLFEGSKVLFRFACALIIMHKQVLLDQTDTISLFKNLKYLIKYTFSMESLVKV